ncbi:MAG: signal peptidase I [Gammaproteobacteria bacterium]|nr:signal peptidase I [Gammaproteobacteria bacterium]
MNFDFALMLVIGTGVTGVVWAIDAFFFADKRSQALAEPGAMSEAEGKRERPGEPILVEYARSFFPVLLVVLLLRSFLVEPFRIPSGSMMPTLLVGDFILVNKFSYGVRLPVLNKKVVDIDTPKRGDVVVFRYPRNPSVDYIKRVIGLPGDQIEYFNKVLYINGERISVEKVGLFESAKEARGGLATVEFKEDLGTVNHSMLITPSRYNSPEGRYTVPEGHYFVMGDNRDNSNDGRVWGFVPDENLVGRAFAIWMHWNGSGITWSRLGQSIE